MCSIKHRLTEWNTTSYIETYSNSPSIYFVAKSLLLLLDSLSDEKIVLDKNVLQKIFLKLFTYRLHFLLLLFNIKNSI